MERLRKERSIIRRMFTTSANKLCALMDTHDDLNVGELQDSFPVLEERVLKLKTLDQEIWCAMIKEDSPEDELFNETNEADNYSSRWNNITRRYQAIIGDKRSVSSRLSGKPSRSSSDDEERGKKSNFRYPKLEFVKFDGNPHDWIKFWGQFSKIDDDDSLDNYEKFQYLIQATEKGSKARELVESFPPSASNYKKALEHLKQRFGRTDLIIEIYVRDLLNLVLSQVNDGGPELTLSSLYDKLTTQIRALETLGVTSDNYAAMLYPIVESALPGDILRAFERSAYDKGKNRLSQLLGFLKREVESVERIEMARTGFMNADTDTGKVSTAATLIASQPNKRAGCIWCDGSHSSEACFSLRNISVEDRKGILRKKRVCCICLRQGHHPARCRSSLKCLACSRRHNTVVCPDICQNSLPPKTTGQTRDSGADSVGQSSTSVAMTRDAKSSVSMTLSCAPTVTILQTLIVKIVSTDSEVIVRALIDNGSQRSYIKTSIAKKLKLEKLNDEMLAHCVFGGVQTEQRKHCVYEISVMSLDNTYKLDMSVLDEERICGPLPRLTDKEFHDAISSHNIQLTDIGEKCEEVSLLIGADYAGKLMTNTLLQLGKLTAIKTRLGWTVQGAKRCESRTHTLVSLVDLDITDLWKLESIGITDNPANSTTDEVLLKFEKSIHKTDDNRYEIDLPWKEGHEDIMTNRGLAKRRLESTTKRLLSTGNYEAYDDAFNEWLKMGIIEEVSEDNGEGHYLAHHAVIKESSATTRIRPVFDGSAKDKNGNSINGCLETGENLLELIPTLLIQFRMHAIGVTSDIRKAFLQISVIPDDRKYLKFLWWKGGEDNNKLITYQHCRVVFGLTCSPFLLAATINHHLLHCAEEKRKIADKLRKSFYVDNCVTSVENAEMAKEFIEVSKEIMNEAEFDLRGWIAAPSKEYPSESENTSILGIVWNTNTDRLYCNVDIESLPIVIPKLTKRILLSIAHKIFDPIGFTAPVTLIPKLILQRCWLKDVGWDDLLPEEICQEFYAWYKSIHLLKECYIPRRLSHYPLASCDVMLHVFCDASQAAYAACVFLRTVYKGDVVLQLVQTKTRVAPTKQKVTMPRLELLGALIAVRLCMSVKKALDIECPTYYWTDSKVVLTWIKKTAQWAVFVKNRVSEIRAFSQTSEWRHVPGVLNPADLPSRGCDAITLRDCRWWDGPSWLKLEENTWPQSDSFDETEAYKEVKKSATYLDAAEQLCFSQSLLYFSDYRKIVRMMAYVKRFITNCRRQILTTSREISSDEFKGAEETIMKLIQRECITDDVLKKLDIRTVKDEKAIIRVKTKLILTEEVNNYIYPVLLAKHPITKRIIELKHKSMQHAGVSTVLVALRQEYWILQARRQTRDVVRSCVRCRRYSAKPVEPSSAPLPLARLNHTANVFETTGVDLAGPLYLSSGKKCYIVLFTCAVFRALHLELVTALTTEAFMMALRRFFSRRGRINTMYSDNGTNFHGTVNLLKGLDWDRIQRETCIKKVKWIFNPPTAAWWGGWWERMVRTIKGLLRRVLGQAAIDLEELQTILCDVEATVNARPLTYLSEEDTLMPLTPNVFLRGSPQSEDVPDLDAIDARSLRTRVKHMQNLRDSLRLRFKNEYIALLVQKKSKEQLLKVGEIVLVETDSKRVNWPLGVILEIYPGKDNVPRVAKVRTQAGERVRPYQRLYPLEIRHTVMDETDMTTSEVEDLVNFNDEHQNGHHVGHRPVVLTTRSGRTVRIPDRLQI